MLATIMGLSPSYVGVRDIQVNDEEVVITIRADGSDNPLKIVDRRLAAIARAKAARVTDFIRWYRTKVGHIVEVIAAKDMLVFTEPKLPDTPQWLISFADTSRNKRTGAQPVIVLHHDKSYWSWASHKSMDLGGTHLEYSDGILAFLTEANYPVALEYTIHRQCRDFGTYQVLTNKVSSYPQRMFEQEVNRLKKQRPLKRYS